MNCLTNGKVNSNRGFINCDHTLPDTVTFGSKVIESDSFP